MTYNPGVGGLFSKKFSLTTCDVDIISVHPEGVSVTGLGQRVTENTEVEVTCDVSRVKPAADIYWRKGLKGSLQKGTTNWNNKIFHLQSTYKVSFSRSEHNTKLYCLVTRPGDSTDVGATANQTVSVECEYCHSRLRLKLFLYRLIKLRTWQSICICRHYKEYMLDI